MIYGFEKVYDDVRSLSPENFCHLTESPSREDLKWFYTYSEIEGEPYILIKSKLVGVRFKSEGSSITRSKIIKKFVDSRWDIYKSYLEKKLDANVLPSYSKVSSVMDFDFFTNRHRSRTSSISTETGKFIRILHERDNIHDENARLVQVGLRDFPSWTDVGYLPADLSAFISHIRSVSVINNFFEIFMWRPLATVNLSLFLVIGFSFENYKKKKEKEKKKHKFYSLKELRSIMEVR